MFDGSRSELHDLEPEAHDLGPELHEMRLEQRTTRVEMFILDAQMNEVRNQPDPKRKP